MRRVHTQPIRMGQIVSVPALAHAPRTSLGRSLLQGEQGKGAPGTLILQNHPGGNPGANLKSISHRCHPILVAFVWELTKETIHLPLGCLQGGEASVTALRVARGELQSWERGGATVAGEGPVQRNPRRMNRGVATRSPRDRTDGAGQRALRSAAAWIYVRARSHMRLGLNRGVTRVWMGVFYSGPSLAYRLPRPPPHADPPPLIGFSATSEGVLTAKSCGMGRGSEGDGGGGGGHQCL